MKVLAMTNEEKKTERDWSPFLVWDSASAGVPPWACLCVSGGLSNTIGVRADGTMVEAVEGVRRKVPGLSSSAAARLLLVLGIEALRASEEMAPEVVSDAIREKDGASLNAARLAASICPLVRNSLEECASKCGNVEGTVAQ